MVVLCGCAKQGMPSGGPKDETPPKVKRTVPENYTLNFVGKEFFIEFDEYVVLKDAENNILVSPPMENKPEFRTKGHGIQVKIKDTLKENTTYLFQFKEAIADFNEGNILPSTEYVFSTGNYIDSMTLKGKVVEALPNKASEGTVSVWLLSSDQKDKLLASATDTSIGKITPMYVTRCEKSGRFVFNNIRPGTYHVVAVEDEDKNMKIGKNEAVGFIDEPIEAMRKTDSVKVDSVMRSAVDANPVNLLISKTTEEVQRLTGSGFKSAGKIQITSFLPMKKPEIDAGGEELFLKLNEKRDTLTIWTLREKCDSIQLTLSDPSGIADTLRLKWRPKKGSTKKNDKPGNILKFNYKQLPYFDTLSLVSVIPLDKDKCKLDSCIEVINPKDSSKTMCNAVLDSSLMRLSIQYSFKAGERYEVVAVKGLFHDIYGNANDSLKETVNVTKTEDYGNVKIDIVNEIGNEDNTLIVELLNDKGERKGEPKKSQGGIVEFRNLKPDKYRIRVIVDENGNGKWDAGDFWEQRQPERVVFLDKTLDVRANWYFEEKMTISDKEEK